MRLLLRVAFLVSVQGHLVRTVIEIEIKFFDISNEIAIIVTLGDVALASKGNRPPHAMIKLSANCEIKCTVFTTNIAFSAELTKSKTLLVEWLRHTYNLIISINIENKQHQFLYSLECLFLMKIIHQKVIAGVCTTI